MEDRVLERISNGLNRSVRQESTREQEELQARGRDETIFVWHWVTGVNDPVPHSRPPHPSDPQHPAPRRPSYTHDPHIYEPDIFDGWDVGEATWSVPESRPRADDSVPVAEALLSQRRLNHLQDIRERQGKLTKKIFEERRAAGEKCVAELREQLRREQGLPCNDGAEQAEQGDGMVLGTRGPTIGTRSIRRHAKRQSLILRHTQKWCGNVEGETLIMGPAVTGRTRGILQRTDLPRRYTKTEDFG